VLGNFALMVGLDVRKLREVSRVSIGHRLDANSGGLGSLSCPLPRWQARRCKSPTFHSLLLFARKVEAPLLNTRGSFSSWLQIIFHFGNPARVRNSLDLSMRLAILGGAPTRCRVFCARPSHRARAPHRERNGVGNAGDPHSHCVV
jgi:hypothetical protein